MVLEVLFVALEDLLRQSIGEILLFKKQKPDDKFR